MLRTGSPSARCCSTTVIPALFHATRLPETSTLAELETRMPAPRPHVGALQPLSQTVLSVIFPPSEISKRIPCVRLLCTRLVEYVTSLQPTSHHNPTAALLLTSLWSITSPLTSAALRPPAPHTTLN